MLKRGPIRAVGAMSGTSLDGVDAAELLTDGHRILEFGGSTYRAYTDAEREVLRAGLGHWPDDAQSDAAADVAEMVHAEVLAGFSAAELVGFHGQTLAHDPQGRGTHQAGCGRILAQALGLPVVWDFRSNDVRMGGEGAPLAPAYHFALAKWIGAQMPVAFLNLGGVGNLTWIDPRHDRPEDPGALMAFDTGPANAPINDLMQTRRGESYDADGALAGQGTVSEAVLGRFANHRWFTRMPPKSLDRDAFADLLDQIKTLSDADACATLTAIAAAAVARGAEHFPTPPERILVTGGGRRNPVMMQMIAAMCDCPVVPVEDAGLDGDMLEAQAFAFLAVRVARGLPTSFPATTGVRAAIGGGQISDPRQMQTAQNL